MYDKRGAVEAQRKLPTYGEEVIPYVLPLLDDKKNANVRASALIVIGDVGDASLEDNVAAMLSDRDARVRKEAARALSEIGTAKSVDKLKVLLRDYDPDVRFNALKALARVAPKEDTNLFISALGDYDPRVRRFAVIALGKIKAKESVSYIAQLTQDMDPAVRVEVARTLGKIRTVECLKPLSWMIADPEPFIRILAVDNIAVVESGETDVFLVDAARSTDPRVAARAITMLGLRKSPEALKVATEYIDDEHMDVRLAAIGAIGDVGGTKEKKILEPLLEAESGNVRKVAAASIQKIEGTVPGVSMKDDAKKGTQVVDAVK